MGPFQSRVPQSRRLLVCTTRICLEVRRGDRRGDPERDLPEGSAGSGTREDALGVDHALVSVGDPRVAPARTRETRSRCATFFPVRPFRRRGQQRLMLVAARHGRTNARLCDVNATPSAWSRRTTGSFRASARRDGRSAVTAAATSDVVSSRNKKSMQYALG